MRRFLLIAPLCALLAAPLPLAAQTGDGAAATVEEQLDEAFALLGGDTDPSTAKGAERRILRLWLESGSPTIDLLMSWSLKAMQQEDYPKALDYLDQVVTLKPDYVEGWNKRATVFFLTDDYGKALADIERVLALEPRHFGALSGLGMIFKDIGEEERAIEAFEHALRIDPLLDNVRKALDELREETGGSGI